MDRVYRRTLEGAAAAAALILGAMAVAVTADVLARNVGLGTLPWVLEVSEYCLPLATFLAAPWLLMRNEHVRLDVLLRALPAGRARALDALANLVGLAICLVLVVYGVRTVLDSARQGSMVLKSVVFPEWWLFVPVAACFGLLAIEFVRRLAGRGAPAVGAGPHV
ncbi:MAG: TRAP transporter small permease [Burkholderiales bacterium]|nr:TRAP transporter small permease [Burkholderiales bacterium]